MNGSTGKKIAAATLATGILVAASCGGQGSGLEVVRGMPDYSADVATKEFMIGGYVAPHRGIFNGGTNDDYITEEAYRQVKEAGLDYVLTLYEQLGSNAINDHLKYAGKAGVKILVRWDGIIGMGSATAEQMKEKLKDIEDEPAFWGIFAKDEPDATLFKKLGQACKVFKEAYPDKYFYVNLFPNYANLQQLQADSYKDYVNKYCALVDNGMIIEDHYPFGHIQGSDKYDLNSGFLSNLEIIQKYAKYYGKEHWEYMQGETCGNGSKTPDYYDMRLQMYANMCYGVINAQYFCYFSPHAGQKGETAAFIDCDGQRTDIYYAGQKINNEIHKFDHVYLNYAPGHVGVMTKIGSENKTKRNAGFAALTNSISSHERIASFTCEQDSIIGAYKDKDGRDGFMLVNYSVPGYRLKDKVELVFNECDGVIYYREGEYNYADLTDGKFEIELEAGEGVFIIPVKK